MMYTSFDIDKQTRIAHMCFSIQITHILEDRFVGEFKEHISSERPKLCTRVCVQYSVQGALCNLECLCVGAL